MVQVCVWGGRGVRGDMAMKILWDDMSCLSPFYGLSGMELKNAFLKNREYSMISSYGTSLHWLNYRNKNPSKILKLYQGINFQYY